jgi:two-component system, LuxR family, response regulator FixJ
LEQSQVLHIVDGTAEGRAAQSRVAFGLDCHAEPYEGIEEFFARPPEEGVVLLRDDNEEGSISRFIERLERLGVWLPVIMTGEDPASARVVEAIKQGATDYVALPIRRARLKDALAQVARDTEVRGVERRRVAQARAQIARLTRREREVLDLLTDGCSNKAIARDLGISPRTVEIHRANMMTKLDAGHAAEAVRVRLEARLETETETVPAAEGAAAGPAASW